MHLDELDEPSAMFDGEEHSVKTPTKELSNILLEMHKIKCIISNIPYINTEELISHCENEIDE